MTPDCARQVILLANLTEDLLAGLILIFFPDRRRNVQLVEVLTAYARKMVTAIRACAK